MSLLATTTPKPTSRPSESPRRAAPTRATAGTATGTNTHDAIARLAFQKWQKRGSPIGDDQRDWFEAERELKSPSSIGAGR